MFVLTVENDVVIATTQVAERRDNGVFVGHAIYAMPNITVHEVENVPPTIRPHEYCYNQTDGFYKNPNYVPQLTTEEHIEVTTKKTITLEERTVGMQEIDDFALQMIMMLQVEIAELKQRVTALEGGVV